MAVLRTADQDELGVELGVGVSVVSRDALIAMKARAGRPQDVMDIQNLKDGDR